MLRLLPKGYSIQDLIFLFHAISTAYFNSDCPVLECEKCPHYRACKDLHSLLNRIGTVIDEKNNSKPLDKH